MKVHVLGKLDPGTNVYHCAIHFPCPSGNNSASKPWQDVFKNAGVSGHTALAAGGVSPGPGQISATENADIVAGTTIEFEDNLLLPDMADATIDDAADAKITEYTNRIEDQYAEYGRTRA